MKKVLLTTSALTLIAGAAAAEVGTSADARMGVSVTGGTYTIDHRVRVHFKASGEADGFTYGAKTGIRWDDGDTAGSVAYGGSVWVSNGMATLSVGNVNGAIASTSGIWSGKSVGYTGMSFRGVGLGWGHASSSSNSAGPNQVALSFAVGDANIALSGGNTADDVEIAANMALGSATLGVGYDNGAGAGGGTIVTAAFSAGAANVHAGYRRDNAGSNYYDLSGSFDAGAGSMSAYYASWAGVNAFGAGYSQGLGGGASVGVGVESIAGTVTYEGGLNFKF